MIRRRVRVALGVSIAMFGGFVMTTVAAAARMRADDPQTLIERARRGVQTQPFTGTVEIEWNDGATVRQTRVAVASDGSRVTAGSVSGGTGGYSNGSLSVSVPGADALASAMPSPNAKYELSAHAGPTIVGRSTTAVDAAYRGVVRERWVVDNATGALVQREAFDSSGSLARRVTLVELAIGSPPTTTTTAAQVAMSVRAAQVAKPFAAPATLGERYREVGAYVLGDGTVQVFYSDGLRDLSVFQQRGDLDWGSLPTEGSVISVAGTKVHEYRTASGSMWVWERNGVVVTAVSDTTPDEMAMVVRDLKPAAPSSWERFRSWVRDLF